MIFVPLIAGKPIHIYLGLLLILLLTIQIITGIQMVKGKIKLLRVHKIFALLIILVAIVHIFYGLGIWFFNFRIK